MVEPQIVVLDVAGSSPVGHPTSLAQWRQLLLQLRPYGSNPCTTGQQPRTEAACGRRVGSSPIQPGLPAASTKATPIGNSGRSSARRIIFASAVSLISIQAVL